MKRIIALLLAAVTCLTLSACGDGSAGNGTEGKNGGGDLAYIKNKGTLVVGVTEFEPMNYLDADGNWLGFDTEMAAAFAKSIGVEVEFRLIEWGDRFDLLKDKTIDVVWNGMTLSDEVKNAMETSKPYFNNAQVVIVKADAADKYSTVESLADASFAVQGGSTSQKQADDHGFSYTEVSDQAEALQKVSDGAADAAVVDFLLAISMTGEGTDHDDLIHTVSLSSEEYVVGFRKGSDMTAVLNDFFAAEYANGNMQSVARSYGIAAFLLAQ